MNYCKSGSYSIVDEDKQPFQGRHVVENRRLQPVGNSRVAGQTRNCVLKILQFVVFAENAHILIFAEDVDNVMTRIVNAFNPV